MDEFVRIPRDLTRWHGRLDAFAVWFWMLVNASTEDKTIKGIEIKRGQLVTTQSEIAKVMGLSRQNIRTILNFLKNSQPRANQDLTKSQPTINQASSKNYTIITICDYDSYIPSNEVLIEGSQPRANQDLTKSQPRPNQPILQLPDNQEDTEAKKGKEERGDFKIGGIDNKDSLFIDNDCIDNSIINNNITLKYKKLSIVIDIPEFFPLMQEWLAYKEERKESYKSKRSLAALYSHMKNLSGSDPEKAKAIIEQSVAANYSGLFPLKEGSTKNGKASDPILNPNSRYDPSKYHFDFEEGEDVY